MIINIQKLGWRPKILLYWILPGSGLLHDVGALMRLPARPEINSCRVRCGKKAQKWGNKPTRPIVVRCDGNNQWVLTISSPIWSVRLRSTLWISKSTNTTFVIALLMSLVATTMRILPPPPDNFEKNLDAWFRCLIIIIVWEDEWFVREVKSSSYGFASFFVS